MAKSRNRARRQRKNPPKAAPKTNPNESPKSLQQSDPGLVYVSEEPGMTFASSPFVAPGLAGAQISVSEHTQISYSGDIPPAELMSKWAEVVPDAPERFLKAFEEQGDHRRKMETRAMQLQEMRQKAELEDQRRGWRAYSMGQWFGFLTPVLLFGMAFPLLWYEKPLAGFTSLGLGALTLAGQFIVRSFRANQTNAATEEE